VIILGSRDCLAHKDEGPTADWIKTGIRQQTLKVIRLPTNARFEKDLVPEVFM